MLHDVTSISVFTTVVNTVRAIANLMFKGSYEVGVLVYSLDKETGAWRKLTIQTQPHTASKLQPQNLMTY